MAWFRTLGRIVGWLGPFAAGSAVGASPVLTLHYQERPPYSSLEADGRVGGLVATPAALAMERAGIAYRWERTPAQRQLGLIEQGSGLNCGVGWFRTAPRAAAGRFNTVPLHRDQPFAALVRHDASWPAQPTAAEALERAPVRLLVKQGYSYGTRLDALIAQRQHAVTRTTVEVEAMARMLVAGRADWMIVNPDEVPALLARTPDGGRSLRLVRFTDQPPGEARYLYCNRAVPAEWLARVDAALPR